MRIALALFESLIRESYDSVAQAAKSRVTER